MNIKDIIEKREEIQKASPRHTTATYHTSCISPTCTNMANAGMDIKTLQYIMGHSYVGVTLKVYTHASYGRAAEQMAKMVDFRDVSKNEKRRKSD